MKKTNDEIFNENLKNSFRDDLEQAKLKMALLKENFEYQKWFDHFLEWIAGAGWENEGWPAYMFERFGLVQLRYFIGHPNWEKILDLINPRKDMIDPEDKFAGGILTRLFYDRAVENIVVGNINHFEGGASKPIRVVNEKGLKSWERIYKIDLTKKKVQIMNELEGYLDRAFLKNTDEWIANNKRDRKEAWIQLNIWKLRRKHKSFPEIAKTLNITIDAVKKSFYRAYEIINWKKYDPFLFKRDYWEIRKIEIKKECSKCPDNPKNGGKCNTLCPDMLVFVDQDYEYQRDKQAEDYQIDNLKEEKDPETLLVQAEEEKLIK